MSDLEKQYGEAVAALAWFCFKEPMPLEDRSRILPIVKQMVGRINTLRYLIDEDD